VKAAAERVGWCPGALRPMASGDGLILRVKPRGGRLSVEQARGIAEVARRYGNGAMDLTRRANLQIRGLREDGLAPALGRLAALGLLDPNPEAEAVRNVVSSPLAGIGDPSVIPDGAKRRSGIHAGLAPDDRGDGSRTVAPAALVRDDKDGRPWHGRQAVFDISPHVAALESRLVETPALHALPAKFAFVVDDGGPLGLRDVPADIRFEALRTMRGAAFAVRLGGGEDLAGLCTPEDLADAAEALSRVVLNSGGIEIRRMADLVARDGAEGILRQAGLDLCEAPQSSAAAPRDAIGPLGVAFGVGAPFGRLDAAALETVAAAAHELRLTPWRSILLAGLDRPHDVAASCAAVGLIVDPADARLAVTACVGAPGCRRASTPVLDHAARLARRLGVATAGDGIVVHLSGCRKGCAHAGTAPVTLVASEGRYDLVRGGRAGDPPARRSLDFDEALHCATRELHA
jgi:precorrin-3B synthase